MKTPSLVLFCLAAIGCVAYVDDAAAQTVRSRYTDVDPQNAVGPRYSNIDKLNPGILRGDKPLLELTKTQKAPRDIDCRIYGTIERCDTILGPEQAEYAMTINVYKQTTELATADEYVGQQVGDAQTVLLEKFLKVEKGSTIVIKTTSHASAGDHVVIALVRGQKKWGSSILYVFDNH